MQSQSAVLNDSEATDLDVIEEMRLRTWARKNYAPNEERDETWHPIILDEMDRKDREVVKGLED